MQFIKAHAYGNDFLYVEEASVPLGPDPALARALCDRHVGVGADGLILYRLTERGARMRLLNSDGSHSEVSGNGVRGLAAIVARWRHQEGHGHSVGSRIVIETDAGPKDLELLDAAANRYRFRASMGQPQDLRQTDLEVAGSRVPVVVLSVGNPQCVLLEPGLDLERMHRLGPLLERHAAFPNRTNVEFASVERPDRVRILIWERGVGPTSASGTGACAAAVAAAAFGGADRDVEVISPGGSQRVEWTAEAIYLTGWAELVATGAWLGSA